MEDQIAKLTAELIDRFGDAAVDEALDLAVRSRKSGHQVRVALFIAVAQRLAQADSAGS